MISIVDNKRIEDSVYAVQFHPLMLSETKKAEILRVATLLRDVRNDISIKAHENFEMNLNISRFQFESLYLSSYKSYVPSHFLGKAIQDVYKMYKIRNNAFLSNIKFFKVTSLKITTYKNNTKYHHKGDFKSVERRVKSTELSRVLTYLAQQNNKQLEEYVRANKDTNNFYPILLDKFDKFGYDRLLQLATMRKDRILKEYKKRGPIKFTSLTFSGRSRLTTPIIRQNNNSHSKIKHFLSISWVHNNGSMKPLHVPIKYNKKYHRDIKRYCNDIDTYYTVVVKDKKLYFVLYKEGKRVTPIYDVTESNTIGIDVNTKHNILALSDGTIVPQDQEFITAFTKHLLSIDNKQKQFNKIHKHNVGYKYTKKDLRKSKAFTTRLTNNYINIVTSVCKKLQSQGVHHISMENLVGLRNNVLPISNEDGIDVRRLFKRLNLSSIKDIFIHIAPHYGISVSLVQPHYTSQECSCGCIDEQNRISQEEFKCIACGHAENADIHSAKNIKNRLTSTVLRGKLLNATDSGYSIYLPKNLFKWQIKDILEKYHKAARNSRCGEPLTRHLRV